MSTLKERATKIVLDETLTPSERQKALIPLMHEHMEMHQGSIEEVFNDWNLMMVSIVDEHNLHRH